MTNRGDSQNHKGGWADHYSHGELVQQDQTFHQLHKLEDAGEQSLTNVPHKVISPGSVE